MELSLLFVLTIAIGMAAFSMGRFFTKHPSEDEMLELLIVARTERLMLGIADKSIHNEITEESDRRVASVKVS